MCLKIVLRLWWKIDLLQWKLSNLKIIIVIIIILIYLLLNEINLNKLKI